MKQLKKLLNERSTLYKLKIYFMNKENIRNRFAGTDYKFGFDNTNEMRECIAFGMGWGQLRLFMILVDTDKVTYEYSPAFRPNNTIKEVPFTDDFYIPKNEKDFLTFVGEIL